MTRQTPDRNDLAVEELLSVHSFGGFGQHSGQNVMSAEVCDKGTSSLHDGQGRELERRPDIIFKAAPNETPPPKVSVISQNGTTS